MTSSWFFLSTLNYDARSTTHQIFQSDKRCESNIRKKGLELLPLGIIGGHLGICGMQINNVNIIECKLISSTKLVEDSSPERFLVIIESYNRVHRSLFQLNEEA